MHFKYNDKGYTGTKEQILEDIKEDLTEAPLMCDGTFRLGEEIYEGRLKIGNIRDALISKVQVPVEYIEYKGMLWTEKNLKSNLMHTPKDQLINMFLEILDAQ
jgi:hypothetical protein